MTVSSISQAADEMVALFKAAWDGAGYTAQYPKMPFTKPGKGATWARWTLQHATGGQRTLAGADGRSRFGKAGIIIVQVFTPLAAGSKAGYDAAEIVIGAYEGKRTPGDVWFRNVRIDETGDGSDNSGDDGLWAQTNVIAEFTYDKFNS